MPCRFQRWECKSNGNSLGNPRAWNDLDKTERRKQSNGLPLLRLGQDKKLELCQSATTTLKWFRILTTNASIRRKCRESELSRKHRFQYGDTANNCTKLLHRFGSITESQEKSRENSLESCFMYFPTIPSIRCNPYTTRPSTGS